MKSRTQLFSLFSLLVIAVTLLSACGPKATPAPAAPAATEAPAATPVPPTEAPAATPVPPTEAPAATPVPEATATAEQPTAVPTPTIPPPVLTTAEGCAPGSTQVVWYIGLGAGTQPNDVDKEKAWVDAFNKSQTEACVIMNVVYNTGTNSYDALKAMIAGGNAPDIVGPVGKAGRASFQGSWADIEPLATAAGFDLSTYDPALLEFTKDEGVLVGIPFALFPSFIYYNKALFDEGKLPYPPHKVGEQYDGKDWDLATFTDLAKKLTVDANGNDATSADFDPKNVKQFGFFEQWTDARGVGAFFGGGLPYDPKDPTTAVLPENWKEAWKWYYDGIWKEHFMPNADYQNSSLFGQGNLFNSGNLAMSWTHTWYTCCFDLSKTSWDIAVVPTINGKITAKLHGDTFAILKDSKNQQVAFDVLSKMVVAKDLYQIYGGIPAVVADRPEFFAALDARAAPNKIDWAVADEMLKYPDLPNHEAWLPNLIKANGLFTEFRTKMDQTPDLDMDQAIAQLQSDLDAVFKAAPAQ
jgi:multiple sugar transport system substrate-binding protein